MKVLENGKIKLSADEKRNGNFVIKLEKEHVKIFDISQVFTFRVNRFIPIGQFLEAAYRDMGHEDTHKGIGNYLAVLWTSQAVVPDSQYLEEVYNAAVAAMKRHPDAYGAPAGEVSDEEDAAILEEQKGLYEAVQELDAVAKKDAEENGE